MTIAATNDISGIEFLSAYCPHCNPLRYHADSRVRPGSLTEPTTFIWRR